MRSLAEGADWPALARAQSEHRERLQAFFARHPAQGLPRLRSQQVRERIPILSILFNNFSMAIELPIMKVSTEKYRSTDISGHYADMAKAFGGYGERITDPNDIRAAIERGIAATKAGQPALLEFITDQEISISQG